MANTLRFKRGLASGIPTGVAGEPLFTTDTFDLYIGNGTTNTRFQKYIASGATTQILRGDGSLYTFPLAISSPTNGQVLKYNGTSWVNDSDAGITGSGTSNYLSKFTGATTLGNSGVFESSLNIGIGTATPVPYDVNSRVINYFSPVANAEIKLTNSTTGNTQTAGLLIGQYGNNTYFWNGSSGFIAFGTSNSERARIFATGNFGIGTGASDTGQRLQVVGTGYFSDSVGIGSTSPSNYGLRVSKTLAGAGSAHVYADGQVTSTATVTSAYFFASANVQNASFTIPSISNFLVLQGTFGASATVTEQYGFNVSSNMTGGVNNYAFNGSLAAGTGRWNIYMGGTANNYMAGDLRIGSTSDITGVSKIFTSFSSQVAYGITFNNTYTAAVNNGYFIRAYNNGTEMFGINFQNETTSNPNISYRNSLTFSNGLPTGTERMRLDSSGNLGLAVTPSAWANFRAIDIGTTGAIANYTLGTGVQINSNMYFGGSGWIYKTTAGASRVVLDANVISFWNAPSGTAGATMTMTQAMTLDASGNLGVGTASPVGKLEVNGLTFINNTGDTTARLLLRNTTTGASAGGLDIREIGVDTSINNASNGNMYFSTNNTERVRFFAAGNVGIGTGASDSGEKLQVTGTAKITAATTIGLTSTTGYSLVVQNSGANDTTGIRLTSGGTDNGYFITAYNSVSKYASLQAGDNTAYRNIVLNLLGGNVGIGISPTYKLHVSGTGYFSDNVRFPNLKGIVFVQTGGSLLGSISMDSSDQVTIDNNGFFGLSVGTSYNLLGGNTGIGTSSFGTSATRTFAMLNGTAPSTSPTDIFQMYSNDITAGNAAPHFRTENGAVVKIYQQTSAVGTASWVGGAGSTVTDLDTFDGYTIGQIVKALRNAGFLQ